jgi:hypothetical protein
MWREGECIDNKLRPPLHPPNDVVDIIVRKTRVKETNVIVSIGTSSFIDKYYLPKDSKYIVRRST